MTISMHSVWMFEINLLNNDLIVNDLELSEKSLDKAEEQEK